MAALVISVPAAEGSSGIVGYFQFEPMTTESREGPGAFANIAATAVNGSGTGGAAPGDVYLADRGGTIGFAQSVSARIQQFSASNQFVRLWGPGVVASGPDRASEVQAVRVDATAGTFRLGFGAATTGDLAAPASAAQVQAALDGLESIGNGGVSVSGGPGDAGGATPYLVHFDGGTLAGNDQPLLRATAGSSPLSGGGAAVSVYTITQGGSGFAVCEPSAGDVCTGSNGQGSGLGGELLNSQGMAIDQASGDLYVVSRNRVEAYSAKGLFLRAWGDDVIAAGPGNSNVDERQGIAVKASGGTFTLSFSPVGTQTPPTTAPIPYNASAAAVEAALNALSSIGGSYGSVSVSGGPGDATGSNPYLVTFHGTLGGDHLRAITATATGLTGAEKGVSVSTVTKGGGYEVCEPDDACKAGARAKGAGEIGFGSEESSSLPGIAVAPPGAPNAGNVLVVDPPNARVEEFTPSGAFVRMFGFDVDATNPSTGFEVCSAISGDVCQPGQSGSGIGQFLEKGNISLRAVAEDTTGAIYTVEGPAGSQASTYRVQKFTPASGPELTPSLFGTNEVQSLTVNAAAGQFRLSYGAEHDGTTGTGDLTAGSPVITNVHTTKGAFTVGQPIRANTVLLENGSEVFSIVGVSSNTITLNEAPSSSTTGLSIRSELPYTTASLPYNASAATVEAALNALPSIAAGGGSVSVTGSNPYSISFDGGPLARTDPAQIVGLQGITPLSGGSGPGANTANVATAIPGGPDGIASGASGFEMNQTSPFDIAIGPGNNVFVAKFFPLAFTSCSNGLPSPREARIEELSPSGSVLGTSEPCDGLPGFEETRPIGESLTVNPSTGHPYLSNGISTFRVPHPRLYIFGPSAPPPDLTVESISKITAGGGTISGSINPNGPGETYPGTTGDLSAIKTTYRVEYKKQSASTWTRYTPDTPVGGGTSPVAFSVGVGGLAPKTNYEVKVVATKPFTGSREETETFTTLPAPPEIEAVSSTEVTGDSAVLRAKINPQGTATTYHFEYGTTSSYGSSTPESSVGEGAEGQPVQAQIQGLQDTTYHFRVVATNAIGSVTSEDQTFSFHPPSCPNQSLRQQTGAAYLPDCRAYELVSPEDAGGTTLFTGGPQSPYATNPPRLAFVGQFASIPGAGRSPIDTAGDLYIATRGADGWSTRYIGPSSEEAGCVGGRPLVSATGMPTTIQNDVMADPGLGRVIDWNLGNPLECYSGWFGNLRLSDLNTAAMGSNAPYLWNANGDFLSRWPTAVADVPGAEETFDCPQDPKIHPYPQGFQNNVPVSYFCSTYVSASKDLNHFVFSTRSGLFGEGGLTTAPGSVYDNDTAHDTLSLVSKLPNGEPIPQEPGGTAGSEELIQIPAVSADGSHILMGTATKPACKQVNFPEGNGEANPLCPLVTQPTHLYMRVDDAVTYDVSGGKSVNYVGSTPDLSKVYFTTSARLTPDDTDNSVDLYMWSENGGNPQLTRISAGEPAPAGNTDSCVSSWTTGCNVKTYEDQRISTAPGNRGGLGSWNTSNPNPGYTDNSIAAKSGDIYFYSPEQLVPGKGVPGRENLYVYHRGQLQEVAALEASPYCIGATEADIRRAECSNGAVGRLQVTPDGRFAAFITTSRITAYDNHGYAEMYRYDAETEQLRCVSCNPDGAPPLGDVLGSFGGRFITDDGRVFFNSPDALDPRDTNAGVGRFGELEGYDVYEYVDGRPQLITTGTGTGGAAQGFSAESVPGLYGVSADGTDVYFGTFDTLVGQDRNGNQMKFYDARTNGGFAFVPLPRPCAAADECHGPSSQPPAPLGNGTGASLGSGGNATKQVQSRHPKGQKKNAQKKKKKRGRGHGGKRRPRAGRRAAGGHR